jgi:hypothetical protein
MSSPYHVEVNEEDGFVRIAWHSREMLYWDASEWQEDPDVVFAVARAITLALSAPEAMDRMLQRLGKR